MSRWESVGSKVLRRGGWSWKFKTDEADATNGRDYGF